VAARSADGADGDSRIYGEGARSVAADPTLAGQPYMYAHTSPAWILPARSLDPGTAFWCAACGSHVQVQLVVIAGLMVVFIRSIGFQWCTDLCSRCFDTDGDGDDGIYRGGRHTRKAEPPPKATEAQHFIDGLRKDSAPCTPVPRAAALDWIGPSLRD
jgi:hypothetical protein